MTEHAATPPVKYSRTQLLIILLTPIVVVISSTLLYFSGWLLPDERSNNGILLSPVLSVTDFGLPEIEITQERHWQLIQFSPNCTQSCLDKMYEQRQMHIALGKLQTRIKRVVISQSDLSSVLGSDYPSLTQVPFKAAALTDAVKSRIPANLLMDNPVFVADPFGNIMLYFTSEQDYKAQMKDIKKLLNLSTIG